MVRPETKPDDVHGMLAAQGILTSRGGRTSHAALVARQFGKPAVVGASALDIDLGDRGWSASATRRGARATGSPSTAPPARSSPASSRRSSPTSTDRLADDAAGLGRRLPPAAASGPTPTTRPTPTRARRYGAEGIGLCRTEHMFFEPERLPVVQRMILATTRPSAAMRSSSCCPLQRADFAGLFRAMDGLPVIIRLIDPPLHEFLPRTTSSSARSPTCKIRLAAPPTWRRSTSCSSGSRTSGAAARQRRGAARAQPDARPARRAPRHPHARPHAHAGPRDLRGRVRRASRRGRGAPRGHDPADQPRRRAAAPAGDARGGGGRGHRRSGASSSTTSSAP